jgi:type IV secretory pathway TrbD component
MADCPHCGADIADGSPYCPDCGRPVDGGDTRVQPLPPEETGPVPVDRMRAEPRLYGVTPTTLVLLLAGAALTLAVVFFVLGKWPIALVVLGVALLLLAVFAEAARRHPAGRVTRASAEALRQLRARADVAAYSLATRSRAMTRLYTLRRELKRMAALRPQLLHELGDAVYRGDDQARETTRGRIEELDRLVASTEGQMQDVVATAQRRIEERRLEVQPTEMVELPEQPSPEPGEITPTEPAVIPEPYPPPDEGTPPQPAIIPEPSPAVIPEPSPEPQTPEERA